MNGAPLCPHCYARVEHHARHVCPPPALLDLLREQVPGDANAAFRDAVLGAWVNACAHPDEVQHVEVSGHHERQMFVLGQVNVMLRKAVGDG